MRLDRIIAAACFAALLVISACGKKPEALQPSATDISQFQDVVREGDTTMAERLLQAKPALANARGEDGKTALQIANDKQDQDMAALLHKRGAKE